VIFFRDQNLTEEQQMAFSKYLGPVVKTAGKWVHNVENSADTPPFVDEWHTDMSNTAAPPAIAILQAIVIPEFGGDTMWVSLPGIWKSLSPKMQEFARSSQLHHGPTDEVLGRLLGDTGEVTKGTWLDPRSHPEEAARVRAEYSADHPMVRTHPITGDDAIFLSERFALNIVGMHESESKLILDYLNNLMDEPNFQVRWHWRPNDIAVWDEALTNHRALSDHYPQNRLMRRTTVGGDAPFYKGSRDAAVKAA
jgi:taurine dioxygenase